MYDSCELLEKFLVANWVLHCSTQHAFKPSKRVLIRTFSLPLSRPLSLFLFSLKSWPSKVCLDGSCGTQYFYPPHIFVDQYT